MAGSVPEQHRTDSLSAALNNLAKQEELTRNDDGLCVHYGMRASRDNPGVSHEKGSIEARQDSLDLAPGQALLLRGSRTFDAVHGYQQFVAVIVRRLNSHCERGWESDHACLKPLPARRTAELEEVDATVSKYGAFTVKRAMYSAPSRLVGRRLKVRLFSAHREAWLGGVKVHECERLYSKSTEKHPRRIDWRHMLPVLKRKPGAIARWVLRDAMCPLSE